MISNSSSSSSNIPKKQQQQPRIQQMYKVGYGSNLWGIVSEDSLDKWAWLPGCIEHIGERTIYEIPCDDDNDEMSL